MINSEIISDNQGAILEQTVAEEFSHAAQYDLVVGGDPSKAFEDNLPGKLNQEFEAKVITEIILQESSLFDNASKSIIDFGPFNYGRSISTGRKRLRSYNSNFNLFKKFVDKGGGYNGINSSTPRAVTNDKPSLLIKLIK